MRKWLLPALLLSSVFLLVGTAGASENLFRNGGFEILGDDGLPLDSKYIVYDNDAQFVADPLNPHTGKYAVKIVGSEFGVDRGSVGQAILVEAGKTYKLSVWYRTEPTLKNTEGVRVRIILRDKETKEGANVNISREDIVIPPAGHTRFGRTFYCYASPLPSTEWNEISFSLKVPEGGVMANVELFNWQGTGSVWFDDMELVQVD